MTLLGFDISLHDALHNASDYLIRKSFDLRHFITFETVKSEIYYILRLQKFVKYFAITVKFLI